MSSTGYFARDDAAVGGEARAAGCTRTVTRHSPHRSEAIDLIGQYQNASVELLINSDQRNDVDTRELFVSDVMPHFA
jgi:hypothetical protein